MPSKYEIFVKPLMIFFVLGPAMLFYSLAYYLKHPDEWSGPLIIGLLGLIVTVWSQNMGLKKASTAKNPEAKALWAGTQIGGIVAGIAIGVMTYFIT